MSSVSGKSNSNDRIRELREEYEAREAKIQKKKDADLRRLRKAHAEELQEVAEGYSEKMDDVREKSKATNSENARRHQEDIRNMQSLAREQLKRKLDDATTQREIIQQNSEQELKTAKQIAQSQKANASANYQESLDLTEKRFEDSLANINTKSKEAMEHTADKWREKNLQETSALREANEKNLSGSQRTMRDLQNNYRTQLDELRRTKDSKIRDLERRNRDVQEISTQKIAGMNEGQSEELNAAQKQIRDRYSDNMSQYQERSEADRQRLRERLTERVDDQVRSRDSKISMLQEKAIQDRVNSERQHRTEVRNVTNFYKKQMDDLSNTHAEALSNQKQKNLDRTLQNLTKADRFLTDVQRESKLKQQLENFRAKEDRANLLREQERKINYVTDAAENRVSRVEERARETTERTEEHFDQTKQQLQDNYMLKLAEIRELNLEEQMKVRQEANNRLDKIEKKHAAQNESIKKNYEYQISQMKADFERQMKNMQATLDERLRERDKVHNLDKENQLTQFDRQVGMLKDSHQEEIERMKNRQREELATVAQRYASYAARKSDKA